DQGQHPAHQECALHAEHLVGVRQLRARHGEDGRHLRVAERDKHHDGGAGQEGENGATRACEPEPDTHDREPPGADDGAETDGEVLPESQLLAELRRAGHAMAPTGAPASSGATSSRPARNAATASRRSSSFIAVEMMNIPRGATMTPR